MPNSFVFSLIGPDRAGIVDEISAVVEAKGGIWVSSRFMRLGGQFAGVAMITVDETNADGLANGLRTLDAKDNLTVTFARSTAQESNEIENRKLYLLSAIGPDRPGVVHEASHAMAGMNVSIDELSADTESASMAGGETFKLRAELRAPANIDADDLKDALEEALPDYMIDIDA